MFSTLLETLIFAKKNEIAFLWHCLWRWQPSPTQCHGRSHEAEDHQKSTKKFMQHWSGQYVKNKCNWQEPRIIDSGALRRLKGQIWMGTTRKQSTCCLVASGGSWSTTSRSLKCCDVQQILVYLGCLQRLL